MGTLLSTVLWAGQTPQGVVGWCLDTSRATTAAAVSTGDALVNSRCVSVLGFRKDV